MSNDMLTKGCRSPAKTGGGRHGVGGTGARPEDKLRSVSGAAMGPGLRQACAGTTEKRILPDYYLN